MYFRVEEFICERANLLYSFSLVSFLLLGELLSPPVDVGVLRTCLSHFGSWISLSITLSKLSLDRAEFTNEILIWKIWSRMSIVIAAMANVWVICWKAWVVCLLLVNILLIEVVVSNSIDFRIIAKSLSNEWGWPSCSHIMCMAWFAYPPSAFLYDYFGEASSSDYNSNEE